ncbi:MAG: 3'(2'),5'-bisphosphate nucleotidase CysQ [Ardenticatenia bacterium]|nr:3'(2'),5'-bisphosphate nucleotidase CysQ [Ardenticatenia bacterium]
MLDFTGELETACRLAREAGRLLMKFYGAAGRIVEKEGGSPQSEADRAVNAYIVDALRAAYPRDGVLAEESPDTMRSGSARVWMVDPLDGTREFLEEVGQFVVQIGLVYRGRPVVGVVYQPVTDKLYYGLVGEGAFLERGARVEQLRVNGCQEVAAFRAVVSRSHASPLTARLLEALGIRQVVPIGSVGLKVAALVEGAAELYLHPSGYTNVWDTAAPEALLVAAGGLMTDCFGRPLDYQSQDVKNRYGLLASNGMAHREIVDRLAPLLGGAFGP